MTLLAYLLMRQIIYLNIYLFGCMIKCDIGAILVKHDFFWECRWASY